MICLSYIPSKKIVIGQRKEYKVINNISVLVNVPVTIEFISLRLVLKKSLEKEKRLKVIKHYSESINETDTLYQNLIQGTLWQTKILPLFKNKFVLPIVLFYDDHGTNNPIGSHRKIPKLELFMSKLLVCLQHYNQKLKTYLLLYFSIPQKSNY